MPDEKFIKIPNWTYVEDMFNMLSKKYRNKRIIKLLVVETTPNMYDIYLTYAEK